MNNSLTYKDRLSFRVSVILFIADILERIDKNLENVLLRTLVKSFDKTTLCHQLLISKKDSLSKQAAFKWLKTLQGPLLSVEKYQFAISRANNTELNESFKLYKKSLFRLEAVLHKISTYDNPIIETPEYIKDGISKMGLTSILPSL